MTWSHKTNRVPHKMQSNTELLITKRKSSVAFAIPTDDTNILPLSLHAASSSPSASSSRKRKMPRRYSKVGPMFFNDIQQAKAELLREVGSYILTHDSPPRPSFLTGVSPSKDNSSVVITRLRQLGLCDTSSPSHETDVSSRSHANILQTDLLSQDVLDC